MKSSPPSRSLYPDGTRFPQAGGFRRTTHGFVGEVLSGLGAVLALPDIGAKLPPAEVYDRLPKIA